MLGYTFSATWQRKRRLVATAVSVLLGVAFLSATLAVGDSARAGFEVAFDAANAGTDVYVRSSQRLTGGTETVRPPIPAALVDVVGQVDGVASMVPAVDGHALVVGADGDPISRGPALAQNWIDDPGLTGWDLAAGRAPRAPGEVVVDRATAAEAELTIGDTTTVLVPEPLEVTVVGFARFGDRDTMANATFVAFTTADAQRLLLGSTDEISAIVVAGAVGIGQRALADRVAQAVQDAPGSPTEAQRVEALTGAELTAEQRDEVESDLVGALTTALLVFAFIALVVAGFSIFNTSSILAAQRVQESALLRALGASRRQVLTSTLAESVIVGLVGSVAGIGVGMLVASALLGVLDSVGFGLPTDGLRLAGGSLVVAVLAGMVVTVASALAPAWKAARVAPVAALRDVETDGTAASRRRAVAGIAASATAVALIVSGEGRAALGRTGIGSLLLVVGLLLLGPVVARPVGTLLGAPLALRGVSGDLARHNAVRNPRRTAATASALLIGTGVVSLFAVMGASVQRSIDTTVAQAFGGDLAVQPVGSSFDGTGLAPDVVERVAGLPEVDVATGLGFGPATIAGRQDDVAFADLPALGTVADLDVVGGHLATAAAGGIAISTDHASDRGWRLGDQVTVGFADGTTTDLTVATIYDTEAIAGKALVDRSLWVAHNDQISYSAAFVRLADGVPLDDGRRAVTAVTRGAGAPDVLDRDEFVESQAAGVAGLLDVVYGLLAIAIFIALMGIANTLSLSMYERSRELGLLRAVGQTRPQLRAMVLGESVIVAAFGAVGGVGLGLFLGWGLVRAVNARTELATFAVPTGPLIGVLVVGLLVGVLAGLRPAWRASRLDILDAIATR
jgi:putative ABC transport system permease protein